MLARLGEEDVPPRASRSEDLVLVQGLGGKAGPLPEGVMHCDSKQRQQAACAELVKVTLVIHELYKLW